MLEIPGERLDSPELLRLLLVELPLRPQSVQHLPQPPALAALLFVHTFYPGHLLGRQPQLLLRLLQLLEHRCVLGGALKGGRGRLAGRLMLPGPEFLGGRPHFLGGDTA